MSLATLLALEHLTTATLVAILATVTLAIEHLRLVEVLLLLVTILRLVLGMAIRLTGGLEGGSVTASVGRLSNNLTVEKV